MPLYEFKCQNCGAEYNDIITARYIMQGEKFTNQELDVQPCCESPCLSKTAPCLVADNSFSWKRSVEPVWPNGKDPGTRIG